MQQSPFPIDVVITWVDGNDPVLNAKRAAYIQPEQAKQKDIAAPNRYANRGEIYWCVRSVNKFMPWVRRIFLVTDGQAPHVDSRIPLEIVDHRVIFRDYEQYLPTFNSLSIEAMMWRIPGLSEHFIYLNDDFLICRPVTPDMFFPHEGHILIHAHRTSLRMMSLLMTLKEKLGTNSVNHIRQMMLAAKIGGSKDNFIHLSHTPYPLLRSTLQDFYAAHPDLLRQNIKPRFRSPQHFRTDELCYIVLEKERRLILRPLEGTLMRYYHTKNLRLLERKLQSVTRDGSNVCFACFYCLDQASPQILARIGQFMEQLLGKERNTP